MALEKFQYNGRVSAALLPSLVVFVSTADSSVAGLLVVRLPSLAQFRALMTESSLIPLDIASI